MTTAEENILDLLELKGRLILKEDIDIEDRIIQINSDINTKTAIKFNKVLTFLENVHSDPIKVMINSNGGSVYDAFCIVDRIQNSKCTITTVATGLVASAAIPILASGHYRMATKHATFMYHEPSFNMPMDRLTTAEIETKHVKQIGQRFNRFLAENTSKPYSFWSAAGKHVDFYFDSDKALELGLIEEIVKASHE